MPSLQRTSSIARRCSAASAAVAVAVVDAVVPAFVAAPTTPFATAAVAAAVVVDTAGGRAAAGCGFRGEVAPREVRACAGTPTDASGAVVTRGGCATPALPSSATALLPGNGASPPAPPAADADVVANAGTASAPRPFARRATASYACASGGLVCVVSVVGVQPAQMRRWYTT